MSSSNAERLAHVQGLLLEALKDAEAHERTLDKIDSRAWKLHVVDPLRDVCKFVGYRKLDARKRKPTQ